MINKKCNYCGKEKSYLYPSSVKKFCSHACKGMSYKGIQSHKKINLKCALCKGRFSIQESAYMARVKRGKVPKFCSRKCSGLSVQKKKNVQCKNCDKLIETTRAKYCSRRCAVEGNVKFGSMKRSGFWMENGYKVLYFGNGNGIKEHRYILEQKLRRSLRPNEHIHHINGDKLDNRIENLEVLSPGDHARKHREEEFRDGKRFGRYRKP